MNLSAMADLPYCYLTTTGRRTGTPHRIEIWFALAEGVVYLLAGSGEQADWVRNLVVSPDAVLEIGPTKTNARARLLSAGSEEDALARKLLLQKYQPGSGEDLSGWGRSSVPVALDTA